MSGYMGGLPGDGFTTSQQGATTSMPREPPPVAPPPPPAGAAATQSSLAAAPATGSITQYATPAMAASPVPQQQQPPPQQQHQPQSYAERSAQAYAATQAYASSTMTTRTGASASLPPPAASPMMPPMPVVANLPTTAPASVHHHHSLAAADNAAAVQAQQTRILTEATRKVQEHAYYMKQGMDRNDLAIVLDRASRMLGQLGERPAAAHHHHHHHNSYSSHEQDLVDSSQLNPKNYYELHMRVLEELPNLEEYLLDLTSSTDQGAKHMDMKEIYDASQYCPRALSRLYLQICAASAMIRSESNTIGVAWILNDLMECVKCVQCPLRGLFLRHYLLQALRDKLPDKEQQDESQSGNVKDAYQFVLANFLEMNKLWVRIQHLPGDVKSKEQRKRREKERNELRILVGTNLVRLSQLESVTSTMYGETILPTILQQIVECADPLAQAYLMDCSIQVFPDEFHIQTLPILLGVCPKLREKVNIRTILQSLMDRLANYYADEQLLDDETDTNQVKLTMAMDSYPLFETCVEQVYNARGPHLNSKEVIRLQTALLNYSLKCNPGNITQVNQCLKTCADRLEQVSRDFGAEAPEHTVATETIQKKLDDVSVKELGKLLSIPLDSLALQILELDCYSQLLAFLPWDNRREVAMALVQAVRVSPRNVAQAEQLLQIMAPMLRDEQTPTATTTASMGHSVDRATNLLAGLGVDNSGTPQQSFHESSLQDSSASLQKENGLVSKLVHLMDSDDTDVAFEMLVVIRKHLCAGGGASRRMGQTLVPVVFSALRLVSRVYHLEFASEMPAGEEKEEEEKTEPEVTQEAPESTEGEAVDVAATATDEEEKAEPEVSQEAPESTEENAVDASATKTENEKAEPEVSQEAPESTEPESTEEGAIDVGNAEEEAAPESEGEVADAAKTDEVVAQEDSNGDTPAENEELPSETPPESDPNPLLNVAPSDPSPPAAFTKSVSCRKIFVFLEKTVSMLARANAEVALKLYLQIAVAADRFSNVNEKGEPQHAEFGAITYELVTQAFILHEDEISDSKAQQRCIVSMVGTLLACNSISNDDYESLITKMAQYAAKMLKKPEQCRMVSLCSHLFYRFEQESTNPYRNPQRMLECLQRGLKLADTSTMASPSNVDLFVDLLEHYLYFFERGIPAIQDRYISGLIALIKEHLNNIGSTAGPAVANAKAHLNNVLRYILSKKQDSATKEQFANIECELSK